MTDLDQSVVNYAQAHSLQNRRFDPKYTFLEISIPVQTIPNNGQIGTTYSNKCFFISLSQGLDKLNFNIGPIELIYISGFHDETAMIDTDNLAHAKIVQFLADIFNTIQIQVFIGKYIDNCWMTTPDYSAKFGNGPNIIRILNKGHHFELITTTNTAFIRDVRTMNITKAYQHQQDILAKIEQIKKDRELALWFEQNDN